MSNGATPDLTVLTPAEIDALWAPLHYATVEAYWAEADARAALYKVERALDADEYPFGAPERQSDERAQEHLTNRLPKLHDTWAKANEAEVPFETEWDRRSGWTRAYLVITNGTGHVHRSMRCSTCYATTRFEWLTEQSGMSQDEIVELAGERACTVCYPSAPVAIRTRPTQLFGEDEKRRQVERAAKAEKKAQADAAKLFVEGVGEYDHSIAGKEFKTVRAAINYLAGELSSLVWYGMTHPSAQRWERNVTAIREALAAKGVEYDYDKALAAARKRTTREGGTAKY